MTLVEAVIGKFREQIENRIRRVAFEPALDSTGRNTTQVVRIEAATAPATSAVPTAAAVRWSSGL